MSRYAPWEVAATLLLGLAATLTTAWLAGAWALLPAAAALALLGFYRDPPRHISAGPDVVLAPADGRVIAVERDVPRGERRVLRILIFLSVLNVHVNRAPCAGDVTAVSYRRGSFRNALRPDAADANESNTVVLAPRTPLPGPIEVRQIAGMLARRIVCAVRPGDALLAGQRFGMIKLGSQTEILLPEDARWCELVAVGAAVRAGLSVLARLDGAAHGHA